VQILQLEAWEALVKEGASEYAVRLLEVQAVRPGGDGNDRA
jgi:hypothetical protein